MKLREFLDWKKTNPYAWAKLHGLEKNGVYKALAGQDIKLRTALKICQASGGEVKPEDLVA